MTLVMTVFDLASSHCCFILPPSLSNRAEFIAALSLYIRNINNFSALKDVLIKTIGPSWFICKSTPSYLMVRLNDCDNFNVWANNLATYLMEYNTSFLTFRSRCQRPFRILTKNLHLSTIHTDVSTIISAVERRTFRKKITFLS